MGSRQQLGWDLSLDEREVRFFATRNARLRKDRFLETGKGSAAAWFGIGVRAGVKTLRSRSTRCHFVESLAVMDHADRGIEQLMKAAGLPVVELKRRRLSLAVRIRAARIAFSTARRNRKHLRDANPVNHAAITTTRYVAGVTCFAQLLAIADASPSSWRATFLSGDVSFLRMFSGFASARAERPLIFLMNDHGRFDSRSLPFDAAMLFARHNDDARAFMIPPERLCLVPRERRKRRVEAEGSLDVGLVLTNYADLDKVLVFAENAAEHPAVRSVLIRPHPGDKRSDLFDRAAGPVQFTPVGQSIAEFSESIDFAIVQGSSAIDHLVGLGVPCLGTGRFHSPPITWHRINASRNFRASIPALPETFDEAIRMIRTDTSDPNHTGFLEANEAIATESEVTPLLEALEFVRELSSGDR